MRYAFTSNDFKGLVEYALRVLVKEGESLKEVGGVFAFLGLIRFDNSPLSARSGCYLHHGLGGMLLSSQTVSSPALLDYLHQKMFWTDTI